LLTLTFQFETVDAALEFLQGRQRPQVVVNVPDTTLREVQALAEKHNEEQRKERKPRSDAGLPRGPYKRKEELPAEAATTATVPAETPPVAPEVAASTAVVELTIANVRAAMTGRSTEKNIALLKKFGYDKSSALPPAKFADFIAACKRGE
jgi:hypothetical protein